jgi:hypothetical protein
VSGAGIYTQSGAQRQDIFQLFLRYKLIRAPDSSKNSSYGAETFHLQNFSAKTTFA